MGRTYRRLPQSTKSNRLHAKRMRKTHKTHRERARRAKRVGPEHQNQCGRKIRYMCECDAIRAARNRAPHSHRMEAYKCPICNGWHLTSHRREEND